MAFICTLVSNDGCKLLGTTHSENEAIGTLIQGIEDYLWGMVQDEQFGETKPPYTLQLVGAWDGEFDYGFAYYAEYVNREYHAIKCKGYALPMPEKAVR